MAKHHLNPAAFAGTPGSIPVCRDEAGTTFSLNPNDIMPGRSFPTRSRTAPATRPRRPCCRTNTSLRLKSLPVCLSPPAAGRLRTCSAPRRRE
jgi:hypothetical protein